MKHIDEARINDLIECAGKTSEAGIDRILAKSRSLKRLTLEEAAVLLAT